MITIASATKKELCGILAQSSHTFCIDAIEDAGYICEGSIQGVPVRIVVTGVGPVRTALTMGQFIQQYTSPLIILCGIAGAYSLDTTPLCSLVFVEKEIYSEYGIKRDGCVSVEGFPWYHSQKHTILEQCSLCTPEGIFPVLGLSVPSAISVTSVTVAGVSGDMPTAGRLQSQYSSVAIENMEGFSVALAGALANIPVVEIRAISNIVGMRTGWEIEGALLALGNVVHYMFGGEDEI